MTAADYTTVTKLKAALQMTATDRDTDLGYIVTAASRAIDRLTQRADGAYAAQTLTKTFDGERGASLWVPSLLSVTTLKTDEDGDGTFEITWSVTGGYRDYLLWPRSGPPYVRIDVDRTNGRYSLPVGAATIEVAGSWGVATTVPADIERAVILLASRLANRGKTPEGVMGSAEAGFVNLAQVDPDVLALVGPYVAAGALVA